MGLATIVSIPIELMHPSPNIPQLTCPSCQSLHVHTLSMQTGIPICKYFSNPCLYVYGNPHMHTAIPVWKILLMWIQVVISHLEMVPICTRLLLNYPPMHMGIMEIPVGIWRSCALQSSYAYRDQSIPMCIRGLRWIPVSIRGSRKLQSPFAYGDHKDPHMHLGIDLDPHMHTGILYITTYVCIRGSLYAYGDSHLQMGISVCIWAEKEYQGNREISLAVNTVTTQSSNMLSTQSLNHLTHFLLNQCCSCSTSGCFCGNKSCKAYQLSCIHSCLMCSHPCSCTLPFPDLEEMIQNKQFLFWWFVAAPANEWRHPWSTWTCSCLMLWWLLWESCRHKLGGEFLASQQPHK